jgi:hypothetical protein
VNNLNLLLETLKVTREEIATKKEFLDEAKTRENLLKDQILLEMKNEQMKSARFEDYTATVSSRKTLKVISESDVVKYLKDNRLTDYISERPNDLFEGFRKQAEKEEKIIPGTEMNETEFLSVRVKNNNKEE